MHGWTAFGSAIGGVAGLGIVLRVLRRPFRAVRTGIHKMRRITAVIIGEDPIVDPDTRIVLRPAVPDIAQQMVLMRADAAATRVIVEKLADVHTDIERAQRTADAAMALAKKALDAVDTHAADTVVHIPLQRLAEGS